MVDDEPMRGCCWLLVGLIRQVRAGRERESSRWVVGWGKKCQQSSSLSQLKDEAAAQDTSVLAETLSGPSTPSSPKSVSPSSPVFSRLVRAQGTSSRRVGESSLVLWRRGKERERSIGFARPQPGRPIAADAGGESERADLPRSRPPQLGSALCMAHVAISPASAEIIAGSHPTFGRRLRTVLSSSSLLPVSLPQLILLFSRSPG